MGGCGYGGGGDGGGGGGMVIWLVVVEGDFICIVGRKGLKNRYTGMEMGWWWNGGGGSGGGGGAVEEEGRFNGAFSKYFD